MRIQDVRKESRLTDLPTDSEQVGCVVLRKGNQVTWQNIDLNINYITLITLNTRLILYILYQRYKSERIKNL